ncbi:MAG: hypothetical protein AAF916_00710 [Planctomycetota bacterium]
MKGRTMHLILLQAQQEVDRIGLQEFLVSWVPIFLIAILIYALLAKAHKKTSDLNQKAEDHMDAANAQTDEMISILKEIRDELRANRRK